MANQDNDSISVAENVILTILGLLIMIICPFTIPSTVKILREYERAVIFRLGRTARGGPKGPGIFFLLPLFDECRSVDLRTRTIDVPPQQILTKDSVAITIDAVVYYRVTNPTLQITQIESPDTATSLLAQTTVRNMLGTKLLAEVLSQRDEISREILQVLDEATDPWGITVEHVEMKDMRLPQQLQRAMASEAEALRVAKAKVVAADGEMKASEKLKEAADIMRDSKNAVQLRYLQSLTTIAANQNKTIVFPLPLDIIARILQK